jgi:tetratricopeptide (TPR) repeat protein
MILSVYAAFHTFSRTPYLIFNAAFFSSPAFLGTLNTVLSVLVLRKVIWARVAVLCVNILIALTGVAVIFYYPLVQYVDAFQKHQYIFFVYTALVLLSLSLFVGQSNKWLVGDDSKEKASIRIKIVASVLGFIAIGGLLFGITLVNSVQSYLYIRGNLFYEADISFFKNMSNIIYLVIACIFIALLLIYKSSSRLFFRKICTIFIFSILSVCVLAFYTTPSMLSALTLKVSSKKYDLHHYTDCIVLPCNEYDYTHGLSEAGIETSSNYDKSRNVLDSNVIKSVHVLVGLLRDEKFVDIDQYFNDMQVRYEDGQVTEFTHRQVTSKLYFSIEDRPVILKWIQATGSEFAYLALGKNFQMEARIVRGGRYAKDTPEKALREYEQLLAKSYEYFRKSLEINPRIGASYTGMFEVAKGNRRFSRYADYWLGQLRVSLPQAYYPRYMYMISLVPRWGGSYKAVREFAQREQKYIELNSRLRALLGFEWAERARMLNELGYREKAVEYYQRAVFHGKLASWFASIGHINKVQNNYSSMEYFYREASTYTINDDSYRSSLAQALMKQKKYQEAEDVLEKLTAEMPNYSFAWAQYGKLLYDSKRYQDAGDKYFNAYLADGKKGHLYNAGLSKMYANSVDSISLWGKYVDECDKAPAVCDGQKVRWVEGWLRERERLN